MNIRVILLIILVSNCGIYQPQEQQGPGLPSREIVNDPTIPSEVIAIEAVATAADLDGDEDDRSLADGAVVAVDDPDIDEDGNEVDIDRNQLSGTVKANLLTLPLNQQNPRRTDRKARIFLTVNADGEEEEYEILAGSRDFCRSGQITEGKVRAESEKLGAVDATSEFLAVIKLDSGYFRIGFESDGKS